MTIEPGSLLSELVVGRTAEFQYYRGEKFYYETDDGFLFTIPLSDLAEDILPAKEQALYFLKWIKRCADMIEASRVNSGAV
jgi:hypothetical protein